MAKKKDQERTYMQIPFGEGKRTYQTKKISWVGLNKRQTLDTGVLSDMSNISSSEMPYLTPSKSAGLYDIDKIYSDTRAPLGLFGFDDFLVCVYIEGDNVKIDYITNERHIHTGVLTTATGDIEPQRSIVRFFKDGEDEKLLIFPDKKSIKFRQTSHFTPASITTAPNMKYVTVHLSRLFGVDDNMIYASGFGDYANFVYDTPDNISDSNAWCSPTQANSAATSKFTGITAYNNHVIAFKEKFIHELYNTKNPFRIQDLFKEGCIDSRSIAEVAGRLFFVDDDGVKVFTGGYPKVISEPLGIDIFSQAIAGTDGRYYYLYCKEKGADWHFFIFDTLYGVWTEHTTQSKILQFANNKNGVFMLCEDGYIYKLNSGDYGDWYAITDFVTNRTIDIKHIRKIQLLADIKQGSNLKVYIKYDNNTAWEEIYSSTSYGQQRIVITPKITANYGYKLKFSGKGYVKLYQMEIRTKEGGDLYI